MMQVSRRTLHYITYCSTTLLHRAAAASSPSKPDSDAGHVTAAAGGCLLLLMLKCMFIASLLLRPRLKCFPSDMHTKKKRNGGPTVSSQPRMHVRGEQIGVGQVDAKGEWVAG